MRFGGHETFHLRPSGLTLGIEHLAGPAPRDLADPATADAMGVGRNRPGSIGFWMQGAGLAHRPSRTAEPELTALGRLVRDRDPYGQHDATWWAVHLALATSPQRPAAWAWFFGGFDAQHFGREAAEAAFKRWTETLGRRVPGETTLRRDVGCLLASHAPDLPAGHVDPEDGLDCPLRRLGLLVHQRDLRRYAARRNTRLVPPEILCLAMAWSRKAAEGWFSPFLYAVQFAGRATGGPSAVWRLRMATWIWSSAVWRSKSRAASF